MATEAVSVGAQVDPGTGALVAGSVEVVPSRVSPARRLTYVDVDEMLEECSEEQEPDVFALRQVGGPGWPGSEMRGQGRDSLHCRAPCTLAFWPTSPLPSLRPRDLCLLCLSLQLADLRRQWRLGAGATEIVMPESAVSVEGAHLDEPHVVIEEEHQHASPARQVRWVGMAGMAWVWVCCGFVRWGVGRCRRGGAGGSRARTLPMPPSHHPACPPTSHLAPGQHSWWRR